MILLTGSGQRADLFPPEPELHLHYSYAGVKGVIGVK